MKRKHLIIGAGSSGCILASKLLDHDDVILVTDGTGDLKPNSYFDREEFKNPMNWAKASYASDKCPIAYVNKSQSRRVIKYAQGIGIGGCSNVNAMLWGWGSELIFDRYWPNNWNAKYMNKLLMEVETLIQPQKEVAADPIRVILNPTNLESKQSSHFSVYRSSTCPSSDSSGGARQRLLIRDILTETRGKKGQLTVVDFAEAQYIEFDDSGRSVIGVWVRHMNTGLMECLCPSNGGEVVLCSGVFESPRILHTSILRQREAVSRAVSTTQKQTSAISQVPSKLKGTIWDPLVSDLMGESLQDHLLVPLMFLASQRWMNPAILNEPSSSSKHSGPSNGIHGWIYLNDEGVPCNLNSSHAIPSIQLVFASGSVSLGLLDEMLLPRFALTGEPMYLHLYMRILRPLLVTVIKWITSWWLVRWASQFLCGVLICVVRPHSRGSMDVSRRCRTAEVTVRGESENNVDAAVDLNICSDVRDLQKVERAMQHARHLVEVQQMSCRACYLEILPGPLFNSSLLSGIRRFVATFGNTYFHAAGTCPMGTVSKKSEDSLPINGVVDEYLRVVGVEGLRVADASIVPLNGLPNAPIQSLCMTIGLKAAKLIQNLSD